MKDDSANANEQDSDVFHHAEGRKRQDDFLVDVRNLVDALRSRGNPFFEAGIDHVNLDGRISNAKDVSAIYDKGKDQYDQFVNDVIVTRNAPLDSPIKNNPFQLSNRIGRYQGSSSTTGLNFYTPCKSQPISLPYYREGTSGEIQKVMERQERMKNGQAAGGSG